MQHGCSIGDYVVTLGKELCVNEQLFNNELSCIPPESEPFDKYAEDGAPRALVSGFFFRLAQSTCSHFPSQSSALYEP